jgi:hypothetical protein
MGLATSFGSLEVGDEFRKVVGGRPSRLLFRKTGPASAHHVGYINGQRHRPSKGHVVAADKLVVKEP